jgi:prevent-host-death family protein
MRWRLQDARRQFGALIQRARSQGPHVVTRRGEAVVVGSDEYRRLTGGKPGMTELVFAVDDPVSDEELHKLYAVAWDSYTPRGFQAVLRRSLCWVTARVDGLLVGFVYVAWDGGGHAFLLDPTVHPNHRRHGIGTRLVTIGADRAAAAGVDWLHVDYEPNLRDFYLACDFTPTSAGLRRLSPPTRGTDAGSRLRELAGTVDIEDESHGLRQQDRHP